MERFGTRTGQGFLAEKRSPYRATCFSVPCKMIYPGGGILFIHAVKPITDISEAVSVCVSWELNGSVTECVGWILNNTTLYWVYNNIYRYVSADGCISPLKHITLKKGLILAPISLFYEEDTQNAGSSAAEKASCKYFFEFGSESLYKLSGKEYIKVKA